MEMEKGTVRLKLPNMAREQSFAVMDAIKGSLDK
jgi:hypothetical protein